MLETFAVTAFVAIVFVAYVLLKGFDRVAGRGPKQVSDGLAEGRAPCPYCAELIKPQAKLCPHCRSALS